MRHSFELSYDFPRTTTREEYKLANRWFRSVKRQVDYGVSSPAYEKMLNDVLLYGSGSMMLTR